MDQAPRSAFLSLVVLPEERTAVMGIVNILKTLSQSSGPTVTGILAGRDHFWVAFVVAGSLKAAYDLMLLAFFAGRVHVRKDATRPGTTPDDRGADPVSEAGASETEAARTSDSTAVTSDSHSVANSLASSGSASNSKIPTIASK